MAKKPASAAPAAKKTIVVKQVASAARRPEKQTAHPDRSGPEQDEPHPRAGRYAFRARHGQQDQPPRRDHRRARLIRVRGFRPATKQQTPRLSVGRFALAETNLPRLKSRANLPPCRPWEGGDFREDSMAAKYAGGCAHVHVTSAAEPIDNHECHCNVCKAVTGQHSTPRRLFQLWRPQGRSSGKDETGALQRPEPEWPFGNLPVHRLRRGSDAG